jgi:hypothetical protein
MATAERDHHVLRVGVDRTIERLRVVPKALLPNQIRTYNFDGTSNIVKKELYGEGNIMLYQ